MILKPHFRKDWQRVLPRLTSRQGRSPDARSVSQSAAASPCLRTHRAHREMPHEVVLQQSGSKQGLQLGGVEGSGIHREVAHPLGSQWI